MLQNLLTAEGLEAAPGQKARNQDTGGNTNSSRKKNPAQTSQLQSLAER